MMRNSEDSLVHIYDHNVETSALNQLDTSAPLEMEVNKDTSLLKSPGLSDQMSHTRPFETMMAKVWLRS